MLQNVNKHNEVAFLPLAASTSHNPIRRGHRSARKSLENEARSAEESTSKHNISSFNSRNTPLSVCVYPPHGRSPNERENFPPR